jgi:phosphatidylinositol kinase/protein kinase (PI-3  family)
MQYSHSKVERDVVNECSSLQRYAVIPLSTDSGLIGWVPDCDTLHALIKDYREKKKVMLNIEHRIMLRVSFCQFVIDKLPLVMMQFRVIFYLCSVDGS